jgi:carbonic anhydrase/acetyltransferase-like protein (isoleucine patch superfamily)
MDRIRRRRRAEVAFRPRDEQVEVRLLMAQGPQLAPGIFLGSAPAYHLVRPNTPVAPFGAALATASFVDPSVRIINGQHTVIGQKSFVGPYATLDSHTGFIKIGTGSAVLDNAIVVSNPNPTPRGVAPTSVVIGDQVSIGYGATVYGQSLIGAFGSVAKPTGVGANAVIDGATIAPGSVVGALARVGPGVAVPTGMYVLPGANVTTQAEANNPALGKVEKLPASVLSDLTTSLTRSSQLASGYTSLYQFNTATGANPGTTTSGVQNGSLAAVLGTSQEPGPATATVATGITFEPSKTGPKFLGPSGNLVEADVPGVPIRATGDVRFYDTRAHTVLRRVGTSNAIRADQGQPISFVTAPSTGNAVTINSPLGGTVTTTSGTTTTTKTIGGLTVGVNFQAGNNSVILGGADNTTYVIGDNVTIGQGAVVERTTIFQGAVIGARSFVSQSIVPPGTVIPPGTVMINNKVVGQVQW